MSIGNFQDSLSQAMLVGTMLVGRLGVLLLLKPGFVLTACGGELPEPVLSEAGFLRRGGDTAGDIHRA